MLAVGMPDMDMLLLVLCRKQVGLACGPPPPTQSLPRYQFRTGLKCRSIHRHLTAFMYYGGAEDQAPRFPLARHTPLQESIISRTATSTAETGLAR